MEEYSHDGERIRTTRLPVAESLSEAGIHERMNRERSDVVENARCKKSDVAYLSGKRCAEGVRTSERFSIGVQSTAGRPQKDRGMKVESPAMDESDDSRPHRNKPLVITVIVKFF